MSQSSSHLLLGTYNLAKLCITYRESQLIQVRGGNERDFLVFNTAYAFNFRYIVGFSSVSVSVCCYIMDFSEHEYITIYGIDLSDDDIVLCDNTCRCGRYTPLACAAEAGNHNIVTYLLSIRGVSVEGVGIDEVIL